jgi:uncharacterized protein (DUF362 family)
MSKRISRREFLLSLAAGMGATVAGQFLAACDRQPSPTAPTATRLPEQPAAATLAPAPGDAPKPAPDLAVARNGQPEDMVRRAIQALGGIERFVPKGAKVIVKPNICVAYHTYEYAATTNPWVVGALVRLCLEAGASSVRVMDFPFGGTAEMAYARSGIEEQVKAAGGEMVVMSNIKFVDTDIPNGVKLQKTKIYEDFLKADVLINVPIAKDHQLARLTLGMKNLMGIVRNRESMHWGLGQTIADLTSRVYPQLTVIDAVRMLMANGPTGGNLADVKEMNTIIASADIVAADSYAATLFGKKPADLEYITAGVALGLGRSDLENLKIEEIAL